MPKSTFFNLPAQKRERIVNVAIDEFAERGYKAASISRMVAAAGIAKGSFYQYFKDKDDLYIHIVGTFIADRKLAVYQEEVGRLKDLSLSEYLRLVFRRTNREFREQPRLLKIAADLMKLTDQPIYQKLMGSYQQAYNSYFVPFIQHEVEQGEIDPKVNVQLLNFMLLSLSQYLLYRYESIELVDLNEALIDEIVDDLDYILQNGIYTNPL